MQRRLHGIATVRRLIALGATLAVLPAATLFACRQGTPQAPEPPPPPGPAAPAATACPTPKTCDGTNEKCQGSDCLYCHHCKIGSCDKASCANGECTCQGADYHNQWNTYCMGQDAGAC
jgi:hypothetical protein